MRPVVVVEVLADERRDLALGARRGFLRARDELGRKLCAIHIRRELERMLDGLEALREHDARVAHARGVRRPERELALEMLDGAEQIALNRGGE